MSESKIETSTYSATAIERRASPVEFTDDVFQANHIGLLAHAQHGQQNYQRSSSAMMTTSSNAIDQLVNQSISTDASGYPLNQDPNPEHIRRHSNGRITYHQDVAIRYLQPPTPPPLAPVIVREIRAPQPSEAPPLVIRQRPPAPVTPPPIIIRERPPVPPPIEPPRVVNKYLPAPPAPPRRVVIERQEPLPAKPQPIIIEKWLPYKPSPERRVVVERAPPMVANPVQRNTVITYEAPRVDLVKNIRELGTVRVDPHMYSLQYGSQLASSEYVLNTMARFGLGNNYTQMVQMQASRRSSIAAAQQSIRFDERSAYQLQNEGHSSYLEKHVDEVIYPDGHRKRHSNASGSNEQEVLRQAEL